MTELTKPLGKVSVHLLDIIRRQVNQNGIVIWYDPQRHYESFLDSLPAEELPGVPVQRYDGSFIALRHRIEPLLSSQERPRLLIYIPLQRAETKNAMIEAEAAGVILQPGARPLVRNTRLSVIAKAILRDCCSAEKLRKIEKDVEDGKLSLAELDRIAEEITAVNAPVLEIIFKTKVPGEMALLFISDAGYDEEILKRGALPDLCLLLGQEFELPPPTGEETRPEDLRQRFARFVLASELLSSIGGRPTALSSVSIPSSQSCLDACLHLARTWRSRRELGESYRTLSEGVSQELGLSRIQLSLPQLQNVETFLDTDRSLQLAVAAEMQQSVKWDLVQLARQRQAGFWSGQIPEIKARWELTTAAGELLLEAQRVESELRSIPESSRAFFDAYTSGEQPWFLLDRAQRCMDQLYHNRDLTGIDNHLERLVTKARQRYMETGSMLSERFLQLYKKDNFQMQGAMRQAEIFDKKVRPSLDEGKTVYLWIDAPKDSITKGIDDADLIVVTSQEIDELCESDNISLARSFMGELLRRLQGALRVLSNLGLNRFIITADHGYIFGEELGEDMKIDPPGGETLDLTRRAWVGRGGTADPAYLRLRLSDLAQAEDLEMAVPWRFACFKVKGGARAYFHGGLSPQELIIPVLVLTTLRKEQENDGEIV